jgi:hypothetical protein
MLLDSRLLLVGVTLLASVSACFAFCAVQFHVPVTVPACWSPLVSSRDTRTRTIRFNTFRDRSHGEEDKDKKKKDDESSVEPKIIQAPSFTTTTDQKTSLFEKLNNFGMSLKPRALKLKQRQHAQDDDGISNNGKRWITTVQICALWLGYILYRAYRGCFILLPAVFQETYRKLESNMDSPFVLDDDDDDEPGQQHQSDVNPKTGKVRLRTRFTVSVLSAIVTFTYVIGGTVNVVMKFVQSAMESGSASSSLEAAANQVQRYEEKIRKMTDQTKDGSSGLAP